MDVSGFNKVWVQAAFLCPCNPHCLMDEKSVTNQEAALGSVCLKNSFSHKVMNSLFLLRVKPVQCRRCFLEHLHLKAGTAPSRDGRKLGKAFPALGFLCLFLTCDTLRICGKCWNIGFSARGRIQALEELPWAWRSPQLCRDLDV